MRPKFNIVTFGCAANQADSEVMRTLLSRKYEESNLEEADIVIVNTCGVKGPTENKIVDFIRRLKNEKVIIAGCLPKINKPRLEKEFPNYSMMGPDQVLDVVNIFERVLNGERVVELSAKYCERLILTRSKNIDIIPISQGCLGACTYCATKFARGTLRSYPPEKIINRIKSSNASTFYLTSQDNGCYGFDIGTNLVELLSKIVKIDKKFKIRNGMMNPNHVLKIVDGLVEVYKDEKIIKFAHIPVQSGSNIVLKHMRRLYTVEDFKQVVKRFRDEIPNIRISTDIIVGYPTETEEDFKQTLDLIREIKPEVLNISKFYSRPGTEASKLKQLPSQIIKERSRKLAELHASLKHILSKT